MTLKIASLRVDYSLQATGPHSPGGGGRVMSRFLFKRVTTSASYFIITISNVCVITGSSSSVL